MNLDLRLGMIVSVPVKKSVGRVHRIPLYIHTAALQRSIKHSILGGFSSILIYCCRQIIFFFECANLFSYKSHIFTAFYTFPTFVYLYLIKWVYSNMRPARNIQPSMIVSVRPEWISYLLTSLVWPFIWFLAVSAFLIS